MGNQRKSKGFSLRGTLKSSEKTGKIHQKSRAFVAMEKNIEIQGSKGCRSRAGIESCLVVNFSWRSSQGRKRHMNINLFDR